MQCKNLKVPISPIMCSSIFESSQNIKLLVARSELPNIGDPDGLETQMQFLNVLYWLKTKADLMCEINCLFGHMRTSAIDDLKSGNFRAYASMQMWRSYSLDLAQILKY
jgi:hypothetical protein